MANPPTLESLPNEVLMGVRDYLDSKQDLKALRLTSRRFTVFGANELIENFNFVPAEGSLRRLIHISEDPVLSTYIRSLTYEVWQFPAYCDQVEWEDDLESMMEHPFTGASFLARILERFSNLKSLRLSGAIDRSQWLSLPSTMKYLHALAIEPQLERIVVEGVKQLVEILSAAVEAKLFPTCLDVRYASWFFLRVLEQEPKFLKRLQPLLHKLEYLDMAIIVFDKYDDPEESLFTRNSSTSETLMEDWYRGTRICMKQVVSQTTWPCLQFLDLARLKATPEDLLSLLNRHAGTLKALKLSDIRLTSDAWGVILDKLELMRLGRLQLQGKFDRNKSSGEQFYCWRDVLVTRDGEVSVTFLREPDGSINQVKLRTGHRLSHVLLGLGPKEDAILNMLRYWFTDRWNDGSEEMTIARGLEELGCRVWNPRCLEIDRR